MTHQTITVHYVGAELPAVVAIEHAAKSARLYRIAARTLRRMGDIPQARKMERQARAAERAIVRAADVLIGLE